MTLVEFCNGTKIEISDRETDILLEKMTNKTLAGIKLNDHYIEFRNIKDIVSKNHSVKNLTSRATEKLKEGFMNYHFQQGKTKEEAEKKFKDMQVSKMFI